MTLNVTASCAPFEKESLFVYAMSNFVQPEDIFNCGCVCTQWNRFVENSALWKSFCVGLPIESSNVAPSCAPFESESRFVYAMSNFVQPEDIFNCGCVCTQWNRFADSPALWKSLFKSLGIPMVSSAAGERNYRYDFRVIYPMTTVSGESIRRTLGEPIGEVPCISAETFNRLFKPDPFDPTKLQKDTFEFVVEYPSIARVLGTKECPLRLDSCGTLKELPPSQVEGVVATAQAPSHIPFTLRNRITIASYSLMKNGEGPVFHWQDLRFLTQNDYCPDKVNIYYQTSRIVEGTKGLPYSKQKKFVEERGFGVMSFGPRMLSNVVQISAFRTCADRGLTLARTSDPVFEGQNVHQANIGNFNPRKGVSFGYDSDVSDNIGVVAGGLVEAQ